MRSRCVESHVVAFTDPANQSRPSMMRQLASHNDISLKDGESPEAIRLKIVYLAPAAGAAPNVPGRPCCLQAFRGAPMLVPPCNVPAARGHVAGPQPPLRPCSSMLKFTSLLWQSHLMGMSIPRLP